MPSAVGRPQGFSARRPVSPYDYPEFLHAGTAGRLHRRPGRAFRLPQDTAIPILPLSRELIGIQVGAVSFMDEGTEQVLDVFQKSASVNTLFVATFTYGRGIAGRQVPGQPLPDHGKQEYDTATFKGGSYTKVHPQYYKDTVIKDFRAPDFGEYDVLEAVLPAARKRGIKTICWFEDVWGPNVPNIAQAQEKRLDGSNATTLCFNNPNYRNWLLGAVEDYTRSYEIDGIMWGSERQGAFANALGASHGGRRRRWERRSPHLFLQLLRDQGETAGYRSRPRQGGLPGTGEFRAGGTPGQASGGRLLCDAVALAAAPPRAAGVGDAMDRQPARDLRGDIWQR